MTKTVSDERLREIRSHIGQSIVRELDTVTLSVANALDLHEAASTLSAMKAEGEVVAWIKPEWLERLKDGDVLQEGCLWSRQNGDGTLVGLVPASALQGDAK